MRPRAGVDDHARHAIAVRLVDALAHRAFVVGLKAFHRRAQLARQLVQRGVDVGQRGRAVLRRVALAEHVEVDAVQDEEVHHARHYIRPAAR